jgi:hypothetical protein
MLPFLDSVVKPAPSLPAPRIHTRTGAAIWGRVLYAHRLAPQTPSCPWNRTTWRAYSRDIREVAEAPGGAVRLATSLRERMGRWQPVLQRPGPRLVESLEILAEALHPGALPPRYRGSGWVARPRA